MENLAPPVVAVIVTRDPGAWFEATLRSFAEQDYPELSVLVLDSASTVDPTAMVAEILPGAFVRRLEQNLGFPAAVNEVLGMVQGASHLLICHDDVALDPDVVHVLVEESLRSNAGIVAPKIVDWEDPTRLLHVGMAVDKSGAVVDRVDPLEIDQGQHDAVQDVFLAPGGCTLVRADLFTEIGGMSPGIVAMGEDLDLCWRAQVAGARIVVAPGARVRHLERLASGQEAVPDLDAAGVAQSVVPSAAPSARQPRKAAKARRTHRRGSRVTLQALQRRHELRAVLTIYGPFHLVRVLPQVVALSSAEFFIAVVTGNRERARALLHAWRWNWEHRKELRTARSVVRAHRRLTDTEVRRLQLRGSARLMAYARRAVTHGFTVAHAGAEAEAQAVLEAMEDPEPERARRQLGTTGRAIVWAVVALTLLVGSRQLIGGGLPYVGQLLPLPSWHDLLHRFLSGWQPTGLGTTGPTSPATGALGVVGFLLGGSVGLVQKILVLGSIPVGGLGLWRLMRPFGSAWGRMVGTIVYLAMPVAYNALALGRFDAVLAYGAMPWVIARLARASGISPFAVVADERLRVWRHRLQGQAMGLGILEAALCAISPPFAVVVLLVALLLALAAVVMGGKAAARAAARVLAVASGATVVVVVLLAPWSIALLAGPARLTAVTGLTLAGTAGSGWGSLLRFDLGPIGSTPIAYGFIVAGALPLVIGARRRLTWAGHAWVVASGCWLAAWLQGRGWLGPVGVDAHLLLVPAAAFMAVAVGLGAVSFERDLAAYRFGWRQVATLVAAAATVVGVLPVLAGAGSGRWDLPLSGFGEATAWLAPRAPAGGFRVLWLGDPRVIPGGGWQLGRGLAYSLSDGGFPDATSMWPGSDPQAARLVGDATESAASGSSADLGAVLASCAVRYVIVVDSLAPSIPGYQTPFNAPPPARLVSALSAQRGMREVVGQGGFEAFVVDGALPEFATYPAGSLKTAASPASGLLGPSSLPVTGRTADLPSLTGWASLFSSRVATPTGSVTGVSVSVPVGTLVVGRAPASAWELVNGRGTVMRPTTAFGYAARFDRAQTTNVLIRYHGSWQHSLEIAGETVLWLLALGTMLARRRWMSVAVRGVRARHAHRGAGSGSGSGWASGNRAVAP